MSAQKATETSKPSEATPAKKSAAVRMMTRGVGGTTLGGSKKEKAQRATDAAKPSQKPTAGGSSRVIRRGASKGR
jgi:hypothetical protein